MLAFDTIYVDVDTYLIRWNFFERTLHAAFQNLTIRPYEEVWKVTLHLIDGKKVTTKHYVKWDGRYIPHWTNTRLEWMAGCSQQGHYGYYDEDGVEHCIPTHQVKKVTWKKVK